ncbi:KilA-N domain-containing protein [Salmonella enterica subsp. enterica]|nr:KilA-N domain-containing protein [Salmonella enterica subsp. enterica]
MNLVCTPSCFVVVKQLQKGPKGLASGTPAKSKPKTIVLLWECKEHLLKPDTEGRYNLNELHRISSTPRSRIPSRWLDSASTKSLISELNLRTDIPVLNIVNGGSGDVASCSSIRFRK